MATKSIEKHKMNLEILGSTIMYVKYGNADWSEK